MIKTGLSLQVTNMLLAQCDSVLTFTSICTVEEELSFSLHHNLTWEYTGFKWNLAINSSHSKGIYVFWGCCETSVQNGNCNGKCIIEFQT